MERKGGRTGEDGKGRRVEKGRTEREAPGGIWKIAFWNVAGVENKDRDFWQRIKEWEIVILMETWVEEKYWGRVKERLPKKFKWKTQMAKRRNRKERARGGMLIGVKKNIKVEEEEEEGEEEEGRIVCRVSRGEEKWRIVEIYVNGDMEKELEKLKGWIEEKEEGIKTIIGGDFNARTGEEGGG